MKVLESIYLDLLVFPLSNPNLILVREACMLQYEMIETVGYLENSIRCYSLFDYFPEAANDKMVLLLLSVLFLDKEN